MINACVLRLQNDTERYGELVTASDAGAVDGMLPAEPTGRDAGERKLDVDAISR